MPTIGETLKEARVRKGVTEEVAARASKMKLERLRDLEQDRYDQFSAHIYARSFLRLYAEYLGLETEDLLKRFAEEHPPPPSKPVFEITEEQRARSAFLGRPIPTVGADALTPTGKIVLGAAAVIFVLILIAGFWAMRETPAPTHGGAALSNSPPPLVPVNDPVSPPLLEAPPASVSAEAAIPPTNTAPSVAPGRYRQP
ncbi:MAG: helix-turn-helix domain-containing protein [Verrucomicrobiae bacterium]|nr:helix-turn-helix domain-containing protein [Verrucomicrobiae bacterium]